MNCVYFLFTSFSSLIMLSFRQPADSSGFCSLLSLSKYNLLNKQA